MSPVKPPRQIKASPPQRHTIGLVVPAFDKGGLEQVVLNLYRGYRRAGHRCIVLVEMNISGYMAEQLDAASDIYIFNGNEANFLEACIRHRITALHYHYSVFCLPQMVALGVYCVYTLHNIYSWLDDGPFNLRALTILKASKIIAVSKFVRDYFCERAQVDATCADVIPNGIDVAALVNSPTVSRAQMKLPPGGTVFANIGSTHRNKHRLALLAAAELLLERRNDFYIVMIGNAGDDRHHRQVQDAIARSSAKNHIGFRSFLDHEFLGGIYRDVADAIVMPSIQEGCSNVVLEALSIGAPLILTDVGNAREAAAMSSLVTIVPAAWKNPLELNPAEIDRLSDEIYAPNTHALADAMFAFMAQPESSRRQAADKRVSQAISVENMVASYSRLFEAAALLIEFPNPEMRT